MLLDNLIAHFPLNSRSDNKLASLLVIVDVWVTVLEEEICLVMQQLYNIQGVSITFTISGCWWCTSQLFCKTKHKSLLVGLTDGSDSRQWKEVLQMAIGGLTGSSRRSYRRQWEVCQTAGGGLPDSRRRSYSWPLVTCSYWNCWVFILIYFNFVHFRCPWWRWTNFDKCKYCGQRKGMFLLIWLFHIKFFSANRLLWSQPTNHNPVVFMF